MIEGSRKCLPIFINRRQKLVQKLRNLLGGEGGRSSKDYIGLQGGGGGGLGGPKKDFVIF